jgi:hypothetical protein
LAFFLFLSAIPSALAKTRNGYIVSFILNNEIEGEGFSNAISEDSIISFDATAYAIELLDHYNRKPQETELLQSNLMDEIIDMFNTDDVELYDLYFLLKSLKILEYDIETEETVYFNRIYDYINDTEQIDGGFSHSNSSTSRSISSTYYVMQIYTLLAKPIQNITLHKNWVLSCNNSDGGYGGNQTLPSNMFDTCFATFILYDIGNVTELVDVNMTLIYLNSFYIDNAADFNNFGGYLPFEVAAYTSLSSTYFCIKAINLLEGELHSDTVNWILYRQNFQDGGFVDLSDGYQQKNSSITSTYYAFESLSILNSLSRLNVEIWRVEFNYWILGILLSSIGLIIGIIVYVYRKRRI